MSSGSSSKRNIFQKLKASWQSSREDSTPASMDIVAFTGPNARPAESCCVDYYQVLGVDPKSSHESIRTAYHSRARLWHPDKNGGSDQSKQKFIQLQRAYVVLSDPNKRAIYDRFGTMGLDVAERCDGEQQQYMADFARSSKWALLLMCIGLLSCCFCCYCCFGCCSTCRRRYRQNNGKTCRDRSKREEARKTDEMDSENSVRSQPTRISQRPVFAHHIKIKGII